MKKIRRRFLVQDFKLRVKRSKTGRGLFTEENIPRGACVIEYTGRKLSSKEQEKSGKYFFWTSSKTMIDGNVPSNTARFINHSCAPNCEVDLKEKRIYIFALKKIKAGEELTYDYDTEYFDEHIRPYGCRCTKCMLKDAKL
ncbi:MAG: SET domain-containing protein-lysine N-methyltransferase [Minisyncoccia bacterium]